jgi:putative DNA primase/helicase
MSPRAETDVDAYLARIKHEREQREGAPKKQKKSNGKAPHCAPEFSDEALALRFADEHAGHLRYVAGWSQWLTWDGKRWRPDGTLLAFDLARKLCREASAECQHKKIARGITSAGTVSAIERLARADRRLAATTDQWDADPWLLNTPDGVVDLRTGRVRQHQLDDYMTKTTAVGPGEGCPLWINFLDRITGGDIELRKFLQRMTGYALTGVTREQALFFGHGAGANGKTVFTDTVSGILGDYHCTAPIETFTASTSDRHPAELADLRGARLVTAVETEEGRSWAESRIKMLTGGEKVKARFMRQNFFEFVPQLKLLITGNHKPRLRSVDEAIRRRFNLIPFTVTIPPNERDRELTQRLKAERPGILAWMIRGCLEWQRIGLAAPKAVTDATASYLESEDALAAWIDESCERDPNFSERATALFASWTNWAERSGEQRGDMKRFRERLEAHGIYHKRQPGSGRAVYCGLRLCADEASSAHPYWNR